MKKILCAAVLMGLPLALSAQSGTNSPYSQYGLGVLSDQSTGFNRGMNGVGLGFHEHNQLNTLNPASYAYLDSLTFIFDVGMSGQITNFKENDHRLNAKNADFEYAVAGFRVARHVGVSFGVIPYTNIGYSYSNTQKVNDSSSSSTTYTTTYSGDGGLHQVYVGAGWEPLRGFAVGANVAYLWGSYDRSMVNSYSDNYVNTLSKYYSATVNSYKLDIGAQYTARLSKDDRLTLGLTYGLGHKLGADPQCQVISKNSQTSVSDTATLAVKNGLELPTSLGAGLLWNRQNRWKVGLDYVLQKWSSVVYPVYRVSAGQPVYSLEKGLFSDRHQLKFGGEFCPDEGSRRFFKRIHYRAGVSYASSYLKINGQDGPKEYGVSAGFGIPIVNTYNNRSILNVSAQWVRQDAKDFITENTFRINIGLTFNERWFAKWKVE